MPVIYFVTDRLGGTNGGDQAANDLLTCLRHTDRAVTVVSRDGTGVSDRVGRPGEPPLKWLARPRYVTLPRRIQPRLMKQVAKWLLWNLEDAAIRRRLKRQLRREKPELVLFNDFPHPDSAIHKQFGRGKLVVAVHMTPDGVAFFRRSVDPSYTERWATSIISAFDAQIFNTSAARSEWLAKTPLRMDDTYVLWCCCQEDAVLQLTARTKEEVRRELGLSPDAYLVVCVGNLRPGKGQDLLIDALPALAAAIPNATLVLVGSDAGAWPETLRRRAAELGLAERVRFTGVVTNAVAYTYAADVFVYPTRAESQGIAVLEAMALKTPVVATRVGGVPESVVHGESGLLVPGDDAGQLAEAVIRLARDAGLGQRLAENAARRYWDNFARAHQIKRFGEILESLLRT